MRVLVIDTVDPAGKPNIGDQLIAARTEALLRETAPGCSVTRLFRAASPEAARAAVAKADRVVFACLAIRNDMRRTYPVLGPILESPAPVSVLACGTSLDPIRADALDAWSVEDVAALQALHYRCAVFGTRGALTQEFCRRLGLDRAEMTGDVAFCDPRFDGRSFQSPAAIRRVIVSDPHSAPAFEAPFGRLLDRLSADFPAARITLALHGPNAEAEAWAAARDADVAALHMGGPDALDAYDAADLHVGFRVHGHVSALVRRKPSYLFEQDGRGCDYGLTFTARCTVPCYAQPAPRPGLMRRLRGGGAKKRAPASAVDHLLARLQQDVATGFAAFGVIDADIARFVSANRDAARRALA